MVETFNESEVISVAKYIMKKERKLNALSIAVAQTRNQFHIDELTELWVMTYEDNLPGALNLQKSMPELYPKLNKTETEKKEKKEEEE